MNTATAVQTGVYVYGITDAGEGLPRGTPRDQRPRRRDDRRRPAGRRCQPGIRPEDPRPAGQSGGAPQTPAARCSRPGRGALRFGTVAADEEQLCETLRLNQDSLAGQLDLLRGKVEMGLSVYWNTSNIFEFFIATNQELKEMRDRAFRPGREPSLDERLELGRRFERLLRAVPPTPRRTGDRGAASLLRRGPSGRPGARADDHEAGLPGPPAGPGRVSSKASTRPRRKFDDHYCFKYSGPWAPFDFVDVSLSLP